MDDSNQLAIGVMWYVVFLFSTVLHEAAHALAARLGGDTTSENQVTLDPIPHIQREPVGMVLVPFFSYMTSHWVMGWASTPYSPTWAGPPSPPSGLDGPLRPPGQPPAGHHPGGGHPSRRGLRLPVQPRCASTPSPTPWPPRTASSRP